MKPCPHCRTENDDGYKFCRQCGQPLDSLVLSTGEPVVAGASTVLLNAAEKSTGVPRRRVQLADLFADRPQLIVGRAPDCDVCLQHPSVSRYHALFVRVPGGVQVSDLNSVNGVHVDGRRIGNPVLVRDNQVVGIGSFLFTLFGDAIQSLDSGRGLRLEARSLEKVVPGFDGRPKKLLDNINLVVHPGEFVSLLGPSGSGKSTLMDCLNGRRRATGGQVLANGEDFYRHFDTFKQLLGYVPQKDIVHGGLTVHKALYYTARLRLPSDTDRIELNARVDEVLAEMELTPHRNTLIANLSGGQIKRVSLGAELLARPSLLYIDEATSGLDAGTESRMMRLFRKLADEGRSILCITHNVDNVERCHLVLVLARGKLLFVGPPADAPPYFGVARLGEIYDRVQEREPEEWELQFAGSSQYAEFVAGRLAASKSIDPVEAETGRNGAARLVAEGNVPPPSRRPLLARRMHELFSAGMGRAVELIRPVSEQWLQFRVLTARYARLVLSDSRSLRLLFLQAPVVALFLLIGFVHKPYQGEIPATRLLNESEREAFEAAQRLIASEDSAPVLTPEQRQQLERHLSFLARNDSPIVPDGLIVNPAYTYLLLSIVVIAILWFGCNNAAKEIVKEEAVYGRERAVNLRIVPYLASKFAVLGVISAVQTFLFMLVLYGVLEGLHHLAGHDVPPAAYRLDYLSQYGVLLLLALSGVALGLLMSACVSSPDRANALLPYVLIPQMILGGGIIAVRQGVLYWLAVTLSPVYWAYRAVRSGECDLPKDLHFRMHYQDDVWFACGALAVQTVALLLLTAWFLRMKDAR